MVVHTRHIVFNLKSKIENEVESCRPGSTSSYRAAQSGVREHTVLICRSSFCAPFMPCSESARSPACLCKVSATCKALPAAVVRSFLTMFLTYIHSTIYSGEGALLRIRVNRRGTHSHT